MKALEAAVGQQLVDRSSQPILDPLPRHIHCLPPP
nr:hypothetical protein [Moritella yayanosii]